MRVPVRMGVSMRIPGRARLAGMPMIMRMIVVVIMVVIMVMVMVMVMTVVLFMFHRVRIPSMLKCLHAPQRRE